MAQLTVMKKTVCLEATRQLGIAGIWEAGSLEKMRSDRQEERTNEGCCGDDDS